MLIDKSYFIGPLTIAQLGQQAVDDRLNDFIARYEPIVMEAALGYDFYQAFLAGINVDSDDVIEQRWLDLLNGVAFTNMAGRRVKWVGFAGGENTTSVVAQQRDDLFIYAGTTPGFAVGDYRYTDASLQGWRFTLELFGAGTLEPETEWNYKPGGGVQLVDTSYTTTPGERWVLHFNKKRIGVQATGSQNLLSPLAGFIYYQYMRDLVTQNTGIGIVKNAGENSTVADFSRKLVDAYNDACSQMAVLAEFLVLDQFRENNAKVYPEYNFYQAQAGFNYYWRYGNEELYSFRPINTFGI